MAREHRPTTTAGGFQWKWAGSAAVLIGMLQLLERELHAFHLRPGVLELLTVIIGLGGLWLARFMSLRTERQAQQELEDAFDDALACWPQRPASDLTPYDVGVHPSLDLAGSPWPYVERDVDDDVQAALRERGMVVVFGPAGAGKSRTAFHAIRKGLKSDPTLLIPEDADGLRTVLKHAAALRQSGGDVVLWLDGLERYAEGLDADPLLRFLEPLAAKRRLRAVPRRANRDHDSAQTRVIATVRMDALEELLERDGRGAYPVRRLLVRGRGIYLDGELNQAEQEAFRRHYNRDADGREVSAAFNSSWRGGWGCAQEQTTRRTARAPRPLDGWLALLGTALIAAAAGCLVVAKRTGLTEPPPVTDQVNALKNAGPCSVETSPSDRRDLGQLKNRSGNSAVLVTVTHGADCSVSDEVGFYRLRAGRLRQLSQLAPPRAGPRYAFACIGPAAKDPCHVSVSNTVVIAGAYRNAETQQDLPLVVSFGPNGLEPSVLRPRRVALTGVPRSIRRLSHRRTTLPLSLVGENETVAEPRACRRALVCLHTPTAEADAVIPPGHDSPAVLLRGYVAAGTTDAPRELLVRAWHLSVKAGQVVADRDCVFLRDGLPLQQRIAVQSVSGMTAALLRYWRSRRAAIMC